MIDIVSHRRQYFILSAVVILLGLISLLAPNGLRLGIDFTGGTLWEIEFSESVQPAPIREALESLGYESVVQTTGDKTVLIRTRELSPDSPHKEAAVEALSAIGGEFDELRFESIGPTVGAEIAQRAIIAVALACIGILLYLWWAFRQVQGAFRYGACAVIALTHDALVVLGTFSILGRIFQVDVDAMFVTAVLTVIGFSVHDTIVVFDRVRENLLRFPNEPFKLVLNHSLFQTVGRSLTTSITVVFTLLAIILFGGETIKWFAITLMIGIVSGTYSSIFNASQVLYSWTEGDFSRLIGKIFGGASRARSNEQSA